MNSRHTPSRIRRLAAVGAVVAAGAVIGVVGVDALVDANPSTPMLQDDEHRAIAELARTNGLSRLSPASAQDSLERTREPAPPNLQPSPTSPERTG